VREDQDVEHSSAIFKFAYKQFLKGLDLKTCSNFVQIVVKGSS
jgi:hypothetical protein